MLIVYHITINYSLSKPTNRARSLKLHFNPLRTNYGEKKNENDFRPAHNASAFVSDIKIPFVNHRAAHRVNNARHYFVIIYFHFVRYAGSNDSLI
jgi:hypothetical protein